VTLIAFGIVLYLAVSQITLSLASNAFTTEARGFALTLRPRLAEGQGGTLRIFLPPPVVASDSVQVRRLDGTVIYRSADLQAENATLPLDASTQHHLQPGSAVLTIVSLSGKRWLLCSVPLVFQDAPIGVLQLARSLQDVDRTLTTLRQVLLLGGGIVTLLAFGTGWVLAGAALRPIDHITQTAQEIGAAQDFDRRVAYRGPLDEVGRLATTFNAMLVRLGEAYQAQRRFVADASHELRTPLTSIRGNLGLLQREPAIAASDRIAVIADLVSESERLSRLVGDLLTLARSDAGRLLRQQPVALDALLADLIRRLAVLYPDRTVRVEGHAAANVLGDPDALTQVLLILLDNALKFTPDDGTVTVTTAADGDQICIAVRDTGPGMAPDVLPHIFERFYQGDVARTGTGTGLGLSIARALSAGQHGTIDVESQVGRGSTFTVTLPRATAAHAAELAPAPAS
jgi:two-component system OmpR family sensor kinase